MNFDDCICVAAQHVADMDMPAHLLPLTLCDRAALMAGLRPDRDDLNAWH
jgi:hypothetical protein